MQKSMSLQFSTLALSILTGMCCSVLAENTDAAIALAQIIPKKPSIIQSSVLKTMNDAAKTKRLDAAILLIQSLAFQHDPQQEDEHLTQVECIPAIGILKTAYGESVVPLLYFVGISVEHEWLRERCALAVREIAGRQKIEECRHIFSLEKPSSEYAQRFTDKIADEKLRIDFNTFDETILDQVVRLKKEQSNKNKGIK